MTSHPAPPGSASEVGWRIAEAVAGVAGARLWVRPPLDSLPAVPGRPPTGVELRDGHAQVHLACDQLPLAPLADTVAQAVLGVLTGTPWAGATVGVHIDHLDDLALRRQEVA